MKKGRYGRTIYETFEEINQVLIKDNYLRHPRIIDIELKSDKPNSEIATKYNKHVYNFMFEDLIRYEFICSDDFLDAYEVTVHKTEQGYKVIFDGTGIVVEARNIKLEVWYNGLD